MNSFIRYAVPVLSAGMIASFVFIGCSSDDPSGPVDPTTNDTGTRDTDTPTTDSGVDTGTPGDTGTPSDTGTTDGGDAGPWDLDSGVCFPGKPVTMVQYLNKCTSADKVKFTKKLNKLNADGTRPAAP